MNERGTHCLANDSPSFTPVHSQIRAIGPQDLHLAKGRGPGSLSRERLWFSRVSLTALIEPHYPKASKKGGRPPYPLATMLRIHLLQQWYSLSDPAMEEALISSKTGTANGAMEPDDGGLSLTHVETLNLPWLHSLG